uniref:Uncharacterized protein n=1 Tax=Oryza glumipatula TaxID=40148 RepID=A0A0E0BH05_9ORYZ
MQKQAGPTCVSPSQPNKHRPPSSWPSPLVTSTRSRTAYGQSSAPVAQPQHPLAGDAAAVHSTASNAADRRQLPLVPPPRACAGVGNGRRLVRFLPWRLESFPIDSGKPNFSSLAIERARSRTRSCILKYGKGWLGPPKRRDPSTQLQALLGRIRRGGWWAAEQRRPKTA